MKILLVLSSIFLISACAKNEGKKSIHVECFKNDQLIYENNVSEFTVSEKESENQADKCIITQLPIK